MSQVLTKIKDKFTTKKGLLGDYNYKHLFSPKIPFVKSKNDHVQPFFGLDSDMPIVLGLILGLQHALAMLAGVIAPPLTISSVANLDTKTTQYLVSASLMVCGILTTIQITRFHIYGTKYYIGTGLLSVVGTSFATITIVEKSLPAMYKSGSCPSDANGNSLPCPDGYGAILGTGACCALLECFMSFVPPKVLQRIFPPIVTGPVVLLIGASLITSGFTDWLGGSSCSSATLCPLSPTTAHQAPWGSAEFVGLGFLVYVTIIICERWGSPIMKSCAVICGLLVGCVVAAACGYFDGSSIKEAPAVNFMWVKTFKLSVYGPAVLPMLATYIVLMMEAIGDITATCDVSRLEVDGETYDSRIQGGVLADGLNGILACLMTVTPVSTFAQNNGVISITKCANRVAGYWCCFFLFLMGFIAKFAAALVSIPKPVLGGMTTFLFTSVAVAGIAIISRCAFTRRDRFVLTAALVFGFAATMMDDWMDHFFTYSGNNTALQGFLDAIVIVCESGFAIGGIIALILNLLIPQEEINEDDGSQKLTYIEGEAEADAINESYEINGSSSSERDIKKDIKVADTKV